MMVKISVRHGVAQAYGLLFGRPLTVVGLTWLPAVFYAIAAGYFIQRMNAAMAVAVPSASGLFGQYAFFYFAALVVVTALFGAVISVPLTREAFGLRDERVAVHFVIGAREFRMFLALLGYYAILVAALVVLAIGGGVAISQATHYAASHGVAQSWLGVPLESWLNSAGGTIATIALLVLSCRYGFFLDAVAAAEDRARLGRASALSRGNFWSIAAIWLFVGLPAGAVLIACEMTFSGITPSSFASVGPMIFAGILAGGLVVLHALAAGASAGAYSELAEAAAQENEPYPQHAPQHAYVAPATAFAQAAPEAVAESQPQVEQTPVTIADEPQLSTAYEVEATGAAALVAAPALEAAPAMDIVTPEADHAAQDWVAPPADAHFGSDPHDAVHHDTAATQTAEAAAPFPVTTEQAIAEAHATFEPEPPAQAVAEVEAVAHPSKSKLRASRRCPPSTCRPRPMPPRPRSIPHRKPARLLASMAIPFRIMR